MKKKIIKKFVEVNEKGEIINEIKQEEKKNEEGEEIEEEEIVNSIEEKKILSEWKKEQNLLKKKIKLTDDFDFFFPTLNNPINKDNKQPLKYIGGVDISFFPKKNENDVQEAVACLIVLEYPKLNIVYEAYNFVTLTLPYIAGFLAFREVSHLTKLLDEMKNNDKAKKFFPQLILVDGNGILHPRGFGLACHLSVLSNIPTIGVAKKLLFVDGINRNFVKENLKNLKKANDYINLVGKSGKIHGVILRTTGFFLFFKIH
jgi:endonuclease V